MRPSPSPSRPTSAFQRFALAPELVDSVQRKGYETPTEIQEKAIPIVLDGRDVLGCAQTGTGKTAAFALPILHRLRRYPPGLLRCLVLTPTRELAVQVAESFREYGAFLPLQCGTVFGGVEMWHQVAMLKRGVDILVATPGRLLDHIHRGNVDFGAVEVAVLDEADRMLDMGFIDDVRAIVRCLPERRQTLFFSATLDLEITRLAKDILHDPVAVQVSPTHTTLADGVRQVAHYVDMDSKRELLRHLIDRHRMRQAIVFTRTKDGADKVARFLEHSGVNVGALHSNKTQSVRLSILEGFKSGRIRILVATDIAARGLDITGVSHVINFDVPRSGEDYVHRVGRTARAGEKGDAITLVSRQEHRFLQDIEWTIGDRIAVEDVVGYTFASPGRRPARPGPGAPPRAEEKPRAPATRRDGGPEREGARRSPERESPRSSRERPRRPAEPRVTGQRQDGRTRRDAPPVQTRPRPHEPVAPPASRARPGPDRGRGRTRRRPQ
ncbi:MAG: DEAD/DEAH box helicase [Candidatus Riflebacteria bacterium]|nr:DEAD/DEAH box helicase [Candidatus Riflebacteria bacterium]